MTTGDSLDALDVALLASLVDGPKHLDMGRSPVSAIQRVFEYARDGLVTIVGNTVTITDKGRAAYGEADDAH